jgi:hypothetical protein
MIQLKDIKEAVSEIMNEGLVDLNQVAIDAADDVSYINSQQGFFEKLSSTEKDVIKMLARAARHPSIEGKTFEESLSGVLRLLSVDKSEIKFDMQDAANYICHALRAGGDGYAIKVPPGKHSCPDSWNADADAAKTGASGPTGGRWWAALTKEEKLVLNRIEAKILNNEYGAGIEFKQTVEEAAGALGINPGSLKFMASPETIEKAKNEFIMSLPRGDRNMMNEEVDLEAPDAAQELGDASGEQSEAGVDLAAAMEQASKAAEARKQASQQWKDSKVTQIKAVDKAEEAAKYIQAAAEKAGEAAKAQAKGEEVRASALDIAKQANEQEKEAANAAQEAAASEEEALDVMSQEQDKMATATQDMGDQQQEFGDTLASDEEAKEEAGEEAATEAEEEKKAEQEADKKAKDAERKSNDKEAASAADTEEEEPEEEEEESSAPKATFSESMIAMIRKEYRLLRERKWGEAKGREATPQQKSEKAGLTADDLRAMVLNTIARGSEERETAMIKLLKDMLTSLQSIEYHTTPAKGAMSQMAQTAASQWVSESKNRERILDAAGTITEMRAVGMNIIADDQETFFRWVVDNPSLTLQEIKNEADAQIADIEAELSKIEDQYVEEDPFAKHMAEVPGHHN